ncbi:MAG: glycosyltransferase [Actinobacteria bacterium]|nr:glycosyltransferase [Actinomycetota bacterium]
MSDAVHAPVSVIVLSWNGLEVTRDCISSLLEVTSHPDFEVIVVDNGSTDGTLDFLKELPGITLIENGENLGFVKGNNKGIGCTEKDILLLNNDTVIIQPDWLEKMQRTAYSGADIGIVGCRLVNAEGNLVQAGTYMPVPSFWGQEYPGNEKDIGQYSASQEVEGVIFACAYIKREVINNIGPLDEDYFAYYEDTDYCLKAREAGYRVFCCGEATVKHLENASTDVNRMDFSSTFKRSRETFMDKWKCYYDNLFDKKLTWHSFISGDDIYSRGSAKLLWSLEKAGVDLNLRFLEGAKKAELDDFRINDIKNRGVDGKRPQVFFGPPDMLAKADGSFSIGYVFTPYDRFDTAWVREMNRMDEIWVTSEFQKEAALASGVKKDVAVIPLGLDPDYFSNRISSYNLGGRFLFLAFTDWSPSCAVDTLLRAYTGEFKEDERVVLVMVVSTAGTGAEVEEAVEAMGLPLGRSPVVFLMDHKVPSFQLGSLYRSCDCLVVPSRTAEPGSSTIEALACGTPVLATSWGSTAGLDGREGIIGVKNELVPAPAQGCSWAQPDEADLRAKMRKAVDERDLLKAKASSGSVEISNEFSWDETTRKIIERLDGVK